MACPSFTAMVVWCGGGLFSAPEAIQRENVGKIGKRLFLILAKDYFLFYWQKTIFNRVSEGTLDNFLLRFRGVSVLHCHVSVLHCHGVVVWRSIGKRLFLIGFQKGR